MQISGNFNTMFSASIFGIHQSENNRAQNGSILRANSPLRKDSVCISPQGKIATIIDSLTEQKMEIQKRKSSFLSSALEKGLSGDSIQAKIESYDEQIKQIEEQIAEISSSQFDTNNEEKMNGIKKRDDTPKTEQEIQNQKMQNLLEVSTGLEEVTTVYEVKQKIDGEAAVLESEIKLSEGSIKIKKQKQLSELQEQSTVLATEIHKQSIDLIEETQQNNESISEFETEEQTNSDIQKQNESVSQKNSESLQSKIEQYKQMQQHSESSQENVCLIDSCA